MARVAVPAGATRENDTSAGTACCGPPRRRTRRAATFFLARTWTLEQVFLARRRRAGCRREESGLVRRAATVIAAGALVLLAGCNGDDATGGSGKSTAAAPPAQGTVSVADGSTDVPPLTPLEISVTGGELGNVTVTDGSGAAVAGSVAPSPDAGGGPASGSAPACGSAPDGGSARASGSAPSSGSASATPSAEVWTPTSPLAYGTRYTVTATAKNADDKEAKASSSFTTVSPGTLSTPSVGPLDGTTVGIGMPLRVFFDDPVADKAAVQSHLQVTTSVPTDGVWHWMNDSEVHFRPSQYWAPNTEVTLNANLYGVDFGDGVWGEKNRTVHFTVGAKHVSVVDAAAHTMQVFNGDQLVQTFPMSAGNAENPTRNGPHVVLESRRNITMDSSTFGLAVDAPGGYRADVEYAVRISNNGEFVHAAPWSV